MNGSKHIDKLFGFRDENGKKQRGKIEFLKYNLSPLLKDISVDYRVNLWQILVRPLFLPLALLKNFLCKSTAEEIKRKLQKSLKWFLGLARNTPDEVVFSLVKLDFDKWAIIEAKRAELKWEARVNRREVKNLPRYTFPLSL